MQPPNHKEQTPTTTQSRQVTSRNGPEPLDDGPHGGAWLAPPDAARLEEVDAQLRRWRDGFRQAAAQAAAPPPLEAYEDEEPGPVPGWHLYRAGVWLGRVELHPEGLRVAARPEPEPPAERPSPSPAVHRGPRAQRGASASRRDEHGEDGEAARTRAETGRPGARGHATRRKGDAAPSGYRPAGPCFCSRCGAESPPVAHHLDLPDTWAMVPTVPGAWAPLCPECAPL